jgi:mycothiol system anti-sigma-R factor
VDERKPDCTNSLHELYACRDGELTDDRRIHIQAHLDGCQPCYEAYDFEAELRIVISARCREEVPDDLRNRVAEALRELGESDPAG